MKIVVLLIMLVLGVHHIRIMMKTLFLYMLFGKDERTIE